MHTEATVSYEKTEDTYTQSTIAEHAYPNTLPWKQRARRPVCPGHFHFTRVPRPGNPRAAGNPGLAPSTDKDLPHPFLWCWFSAELSS